MGVVVNHGKETQVSPVLAWLFERGWEPNWETSITSQIAINAAIIELAEKVTDVHARNQIQETASKCISMSSAKLANKGERIETYTTDDADY